MKIYVAGKFEDKERVLEIYKKIEELGHEISYDWTKHKPIKPYIKNQYLARTYSENELKGISESDIFIYLSNKGGTTLTMEVGAALMSSKTIGKPLIYAVGEFNAKSPWLFNERIKRVNTLEEVLKKLK